MVRARTIAFFFFPTFTALAQDRTGAVQVRARLRWKRERCAKRDTTAEVAGRTYRDLATAAFAPEAIRPAIEDPAALRVHTRVVHGSGAAAGEAQRSAPRPPDRGGASDVEKQWNTVATLCQNTGPLTSRQQARRRGVKVMRAALDPNYP
ncbi:MAG: hypothetical protein FJW39_17840 [Acidobacteria bacterium]|nr:hypothetical protein [Acidobacteriota bacterium]